MYSIYKYEIGVLEKQTIELPKDAIITRCEDVDGRFYLWAIVNTGKDWPKEKRYLEAYKTGAIFTSSPDDLRFIGVCKVFVQMELALYFFENRTKLL